MEKKMRNRSVMNSSVQNSPRIGGMSRSVFDRSHGWKGDFDAGWLIPFYVDEVLPGDDFRLKHNILLRFNSPLVKPIMDNLFLDTFYFFVPNRILQTNWKKLMGEQDDPGDSISFTVPQITSPNVASGGIPVGHLFDYMGLPTGPLNGGGATTGITFNNLHGRAYNQIFKHWFRDELIIDSPVIDVDDGPDTWTDYTLRRRGKRFNYFTAASPYLQKGTAVSLPLGTSAPIEYVAGGSVPVKLRQAANDNLYIGPSAIGVNAASSLDDNGGGNTLIIDPNGTLEADLSGATAATINSLREAIATQQFLEKDVFGGTRYIELIKNHFGVTSPDARHSRPELLFTSSGRINVTPVTQGSASGLTGGSTYQGNLSGYGTGADVGKGWSKGFTEHGVLLGLLSVRADITYQRGMDRMWQRQTRYDFYWPTFANLGQQEILNREIYADLADGDGATEKDGVFGYIPRYDEYRTKLSKIVGTLNSHAASSLDVWHLSQEFTSQPTLNETFIEDNPPIDRVIAVPSESHFIADVYIDLKCARPMPVSAMPGLYRL